MAKKVRNSIELQQRKRRRIEDSKLDTKLFASVANYTSRKNDPDDDDNDEDELQDYELAPRSFEQLEDENLVEGLPVKTSNGEIKRVLLKKKEKSDEELESSESEEEDTSTSAEEPNSTFFDEDKEDRYKDLAPELRNRRLQEDIASLSDKLMEDPHENVILLSRLLDMTTSHNPITAKLSLLSLVPVFKSICPSYMVRPLTDAEHREKVTKEVQKIRYFEQNLVKYYQRYVKLLAKDAAVFSTSPRASELDVVMGILATRAAIQLAESLRFFNFRANLFKILIRRIMHTPNSDPEYNTFKQCVKTIESLLVEDAQYGAISFDIVRILCRAVRHRQMKVNESVINIFLSLSVLGDYDPRMLREQKEEEIIKRKKKDRIFLTKKQRKQLKERKQIEEEMRKAEQKITRKQREQYQADILKQLLTLYFEILKARPDKLMAPVLEGLAKFGHQINLDMMGDFLMVLREISSDLLNEQSSRIMTSNEIRQILLCIITSFTLVSYMPAKRVHLDLNKFVEYLYSLLPSLSQDAEIEFSHKTLRLMDPLATQLQIKPSVNVSTEAELLLRCLNAIFFSSRSGSEERAMAFTKRLYSSLLHFPEKTSIAVTKFIKKLMARYNELTCLYTTEDRVQNGVYHPEADNIDRANTKVAVLWENVLLERHYNPTVSMAVKSLMKRSAGNGSI